jgi:hypothetical protein
MVEISYGLFLHDGYATVECQALVTEVNAVTIVGGSFELAFANAVLNELVLNAVYTVLAEANVDNVVTGVVISPTGKNVSLIGVALHYVRNRFEDLLVYAGQSVNVAGIVDSCQRSFGNLFNYLVNRTIQASAELVFEVSDLSVSFSKTCAVFVAVFSNGANGNNGSAPVGLVELVSSGKKCFADNLGAAPRVGVVRDSNCAEVETEGEVLSDVEFLGKAGADRNHTVVDVVPSEVATILRIFSESPVETTTSVNISVVNAAGTVATPPVSEVQHNVERRTEIVQFGLVVLIVVHRFVCTNTHLNVV